MIRNLSHMFVISSSLMHVFCCGVPLVMSITALTGSFGVLGAPLWFEQIERELLLFSGALLLFTAAAQWISQRLDCRREGACVHPPCDKSKRRSALLFYGAVGLYLFSILLRAMA